MPFLPGLWERVLLLGHTREPSPLVDVYAAAVLPAVERARDIGILQALHDQPRSAPTLAQDLNLDVGAVTALLPVLEAAGYIEARDDAYHTTPTAERWLVGDDHGVAAMLRAWDEVLLPYWREHLDTALQGDDAPDLYTWLSQHPREARIVVEGYLAQAREIAPVLAHHVDLPPGATRLLDVGGGHGHYSANLCDANPRLRATVLDRPTALGVAKTHLPDVAGGEHVDLHPGHPLDDPLPRGYHVALLAHTVHSYPEPELPLLVRRINDTLLPGGRLIILDQFREVAKGDLEDACLDVLDLHHRIASGGNLHSAKTLGELLEHHGFVLDRVERLKGVSATGVLVLDKVTR